MLRVLRNLVNNKRCYNYIMKHAPKLTNSPNISLHNYQCIKVKKQEPSMKTFEGTLACGEVSYLLFHYINSNIETNYDFNIKFMLSSFGYGKYLEDHLYLKVNDKYIIDPTYKQFLTAYDKEGEYNSFLFEECPFIFVDTTISNLYKKCQEKYLETCNKKLSDENLIFWQDSKDVTDLYLKKDFSKLYLK